MLSPNARVISVILSIFLSGASAWSQNTEIYNRFAGKYVTGHSFGGGSIILKADGTFSEGGGSDDGTVIKTEGNYRLAGSKLQFEITKDTLRRGDRPEIDLLNAAEVKKYFGSSEKPTPKEFVRIPVEWAGRIYLIPEEDMRRFADAVNLGIEPRPELTSDDYKGSPWLGSFYLREGDEKKKATGRPVLPAQWNELLLTRPIRATVIKIDHVEEKKYGTVYTATINRGSRDGLRVGMMLVRADENLMPGDTEVVSVESRRAQITTRNVPGKLRAGQRISSVFKSRWRMFGPKEPR